LIGAGTSLAYNSGIITWSNGHAAADNNFIDGHDALTASTTESSADKILIKNEEVILVVLVLYITVHIIFMVREN
jgi:hypothetical protein